MDTDFHQIFERDANHINRNSPVKIGNGVWIGAAPGYLSDGLYIKLLLTQGSRRQRKSVIRK